MLPYILNKLTHYRINPTKVEDTCDNVDNFLIGNTKGNTASSSNDGDCNQHKSQQPVQEILEFLFVVHI